MVNTPHINQKAEIAETILLPGDPLRAKFIADNYLKDIQQFNNVRKMLGFTGYFNNKKISVMGTGMGVASIGIYSYELMNFCGVKNLIRIGDCGALQENLNLCDIVVGVSALTNSNFASQYQLPGTIAPTASYHLINETRKIAERLNYNVHYGNVLSSDTFYDDNQDDVVKWAKMGVLGIEMDAAALYLNAARCNANALCILTVSAHIIKKEETTPKQRQTAFTDMLKLALEMGTNF